MSSRIWERPLHLKFPKIFSKFVTSDITDNKRLIEYRVIDIPIDRYDEACAFMVKHFVPYEPKLVSRNGKDDPQVIQDYYDRYMYGIKQKVSVACIKTGSEEFVAVNILEVRGRYDKEIDFHVMMTKYHLRNNIT